MKQQQQQQQKTKQKNNKHGSKWYLKPLNTHRSTFNTGKFLEPAKTALNYYWTFVTLTDVQVDREYTLLLLHDYCSFH